jgi:8-oxo-dGTP diphosphatase
MAEAVVREVREETGLMVSVGAVVGRAERAGPGDLVYVIDDVACTVSGGHLRAGDDADDVRWVPPAELGALPLTSGLIDALTEWEVLAPADRRRR